MWRDANQLRLRIEQAAVLRDAGKGLAHQQPAKPVFRHANVHKLIQDLIGEFRWLHLLFDLQHAPHRFFPRWEPAQVSGYRSQLRCFRRHYPGATLYVQRGRVIDRLIATAQPTDAPDKEIRSRFTCVIAREAGHLHGGLKRWLVTHIIFAIT